MAGTYYPTKDAEFSIWLGNFISVANINAAELHHLGAVTLFIIYKVDKVDIVDEGDVKRVKKDEVFKEKRL